MCNEAIPRVQSAVNEVPFDITAVNFAALEETWEPQSKALALYSSVLAMLTRLPSTIGVLTIQDGGMTMFLRGPM